jgi:predicted lipoprotein with Yx(FWY)xxD motif
VGDGPLYFFANDVAPGDTNGQGIGDVWYVVGPDGTAIDDT